MAQLTFADGVIKIDGASVDGLLKSLSISGEVTFSQHQLDGLSGTNKVPMGWSDADITAALDLITDNEKSCYDRLAEVNSIFKARDKGPKVFEVTNRHLAARGIRQVVFSKFSSSESDSDDIISVTLEFTEYEPSVTKYEKGLTTAKEAAAGAVANSPVADSGILDMAKGVNG